MTVAEFVTKYIGQKVDYDGAFGAQCVDLFRQYEKDVLNIPVHTGAVEGAKDLFLLHNVLKQKQFFERLTSSKKKKLGDVLVYDGTPQNKYGHVCIFLGESDGEFLVFEQDGIKQDGAKLSLRSGYNLLGMLRRVY